MLEADDWDMSTAYNDLLTNSYIDWARPCLQSLVRLTRTPDKMVDKV